MIEMQPGETGFAPVNGIQLAYEVRGQGSPLILIHGGLLDRRMWDEQVLALRPTNAIVNSWASTLLSTTSHSACSSRWCLGQ